MNEREDRNTGEKGYSNNSYEDAGSVDSQLHNAYWSSQDARRANRQGTGNSYYGGGGYSQQPPYDDMHNNRNQRDSYQYSANNGWQNHNRPNDRYEWNFAEYDQYSQRRTRKRNGYVIFGISLICVICLSLLTLGGISLYTYFVEEPSGLLETQPETKEALPFSKWEKDDKKREDKNTLNPEASGLEIANRPPISEALPAAGEKLTIPQVAEMVSPSVVGVVTYQNVKFFEPIGSGSGIIMSEDGYIITNAHVVAGSDAIKVTLHNDEVYQATLVGADMRTDLAVIKIEETNLKVAVFGDSTSLKVGESVVAIGNPAGMLSGSVTQGIVSALNRQMRTSSMAAMTTFIQTDAAINPGNSGGALVNEYGQVIGINSSKIVAEGYEGIGFAIPINEAKPIVDDLIRNGRVTGRVLLGITPEVVDEVVAKTYSVPPGVQIVDMNPDADISKKGVQVGDIITHLDGERVFVVEDIWNLLNKHKVGDSVELTLYRQSRLLQGSTYTVNVVLYEDKG